MAMIAVAVLVAVMSGFFVFVWTRKHYQVELYKASELLAQQDQAQQTLTSENSDQAQQIADLTYRLKRCENDLAAAQRSAD
jgi:septal ring factor EnvC (AmiA/AmiB activator)